MSQPTARVLTLLEILQSGGTHTAGELAERLGVDERTARRYIEHLVDLEIPVWSERGRHGGYRLAPGYRMPPLMLTDDEALAALVALLTSQRAGLPTSNSAASEAAAAKVRRVLPDALGRRLDALLTTTEFTVPAKRAADTEAEVLLTVAEAARARRPISFSYTDRYQRDSRRTVHPYGIVAHNGRWYLTGEDPAQDDLRTFRLDRVRSVQQLSGSFVVPDGFDPTDRLLTGLAETPWRHDISVRVQGTVEQVQARLPTGLGTVQPLRDGASAEAWVRVRLRTEHLDWVPSLLVSLGRPFMIEQPEELRDEVRDLARRLAAYADDTGD